MITRLYRCLLIRLMPNSCLDAVYEVIEEYIASDPRQPRNVEDAYGTLADLLDDATEAGWMPEEERFWRNWRNN